MLERFHGGRCYSAVHAIGRAAWRLNMQGEQGLLDGANVFAAQQRKLVAKGACVFHG
jgi:hypothetical protein